MSIINKVKKYSLREMFNIFLRKCLNTQIGKIHYLRLNVDINKINQALEGFNVNVKKLVFEDFLKGDQNVFKGEKLNLIKKRLDDHSYIAYGIFEDDKLIYSTWISTQRLGLSVELKEPIMLLSNEGLLEDSYCHPTARGRGLHLKMNYFRIKKLYELGKNRVLAMVLDGNTPAFKVQYKCGMEELGTFYCGKIMGFKYSSLKKRKYDQK